MTTEIKLFENSQIRSSWDENKEVWYFSIIDVISILVGNDRPRKYWNDLKKKLLGMGFFQLSEKIGQLKMVAPDGKLRETDVCDAKTLLRIIQSIPSPRAEPIKQWLATVGFERMKETVDPEISIVRARENWQRMGYSDSWIKVRLSGQDTRGKLTDYWKSHEINTDEEYAILTNLIHKSWSDESVKSHKNIKGLKDQNLRDHMSEAELIFTALAELSTRQIAERDKAIGMKANATAGLKGGKVARSARINYEKQTGQKVITGDNYLPLAKKLTGKR